MRQYPFINPASIGSTEKIEAILGSKNHIGNFSAISTNFAGVFASIKKSSQRPFNVIGLRFDNDQKGNIYPGSGHTSLMHFILEYLAIITFQEELTLED